MGTLWASLFTSVDFCCCRPLTICLTLLCTQERDGTIVDPLGSLNNITMQSRVSPHQNISRNTCKDPQGRELTAALTVGKKSTLHQTLKYIKDFPLERNFMDLINVGKVLLSQAFSLKIREYTKERNHIVVINVERVSVHLAV